MPGLFGLNLPFGMSNQSNPNPNPVVNGNNNNTQNNPNFPAKSALDQKNATLDPNATPNAGQPDPALFNPDGTPKSPGSQLDNFKDMFTLPVGADGKPIITTDPLAAPVLQPDAKKLREAASKMNFTAGVSQELLQKAMSGQDPQAFMELLNTVAQNGFFTALQANAGVVQSALSTHTSRLDQALPDRIRNIQIGQVGTKHPALSHPAAVPMVAALKSQIAATNPHLSPEKVAEHAENYIIAMATDMNTSTQKEVNAKNPKNETDWMALLTGQ